nr:MAG TPA: hypothetical protein [Caudoviricetes sp.]
MDKNIFNNLLSNVDTLQTRLRSYNSFKNEHRGKNNLNIPSEITFLDQNGELLASFTLDSNTSHEILSLLIERTKAELEATAETIKSMITEDET